MNHLVPRIITALFSVVICFAACMRIGQVMILMTLCLLFTYQVAFGQDTLDLVIPKFQVENVTMEEAVWELHKWRLPVSFESLPTEEQPLLISVNVEDASVDEILDSLVSEDPRYLWEQYSSRAMPVSQRKVINVLPAGAKQAPDNLMNIRVKQLELRDIDPSNAIRKIHQLVPELREAYWKLIAPGGLGSEITSLPPPKNTYSMNLKLENVSVREVLNEISLRGGLMWIYESSESPPKYVWRVFY